MISSENAIYLLDDEVNLWAFERYLDGWMIHAQMSVECRGRKAVESAKTGCGIIDFMENKKVLKCHKCKQGELVIRQSKRGPFMGCNRFPKCRTIVSHKEIEHLRELQEKGQWPPATLDEADVILGRKKKRKAAAAKK